MKFPEIPTDSLYKFMALSGITILIVSFLPFYLSSKARVRLIHIGGEVEIAILKTEWLSTDVDDLKDRETSLNKQVNELKKQVSYSEIPAGIDANQPLSEVRKERECKLIEIEGKKEELEAQLLASIESIRKLEILHAQIKTKIREVKYLNEWLKRLNQFGFIGIILGFVLSTSGFLLWYKKLQVSLDMIIKNKLKDDQKQ